MKKLIKAKRELLSNSGDLADISCVLEVVFIQVDYRLNQAKVGFFEYLGYTEEQVEKEQTDAISNGRYGETIIDLSTIKKDKALYNEVIAILQS